MAGELRIKHRQASLEELGQLADPPLTKDAIAGRIRRLLALADGAAVELGMPGTEAHLTAGHARALTSCPRPGRARPSPARQPGPSVGAGRRLRGTGRRRAAAGRDRSR